MYNLQLVILNVLADTFTCSIWGPLVPLYLYPGTSSDISSRLLKARVGSLIRIAEANVMYMCSLRSTWGTYCQPLALWGSNLR